jgi:SPX domain protein involved in polyphosphate accumulation
MPKLNAHERKFFTVLYSELDKVASFYNEREAEATQKLSVLEQQLEELEEHRRVYHDARSRSTKFSVPLPKPPLAIARMAKPTRFMADYSMPDRQFRPEAYAAAKKSLKAALLEEYKLLNYIKSYRIINRTGFSKILKKFEKSTEIPCSQEFMLRVNQSNFVQSTKPDELSSKVEQLFATHFTQGSKKRALERLRFEGHSKTHHFASARAGFLIGLSKFPELWRRL